MVPERKKVSVDRLMRRSTLQDHITVNELPMPDGGQRVELIKLRSSFTSFASPTLSADVTAGESHNPATPQCNTLAGSDHDILVTLPNAELVEMQPNASGWFAVLLIDKAAKLAIASFVNAGRRHFKETNMNGGFVSPFSEPLLSEKGHARVHVKISEMGGRLMHTTFCDVKGDALYQPGDEVLNLHDKPLLGPCSPTVHMAGYWHDETMQGPLLYLTGVNAISKSLQSELINEAPMISELLKSPGGTISRRSFTSPMSNDTPEEGAERLENVFGEWVFGSQSPASPSGLHYLMVDETLLKRYPSPPAPGSEQGANVARPSTPHIGSTPLVSAPPTKPRA